MKPTVIDPETATRANAYALWIDAPNPMVTFFKTRVAVWVRKGGDGSILNLKALWNGKMYDMKITGNNNERILCVLFGT